MNVFSVFGHWTEILQPFDKFFSAGGCQNCLLRVHRNILREKFFWTKDLYFAIFAQGANIFSLKLEFFRGVVETAFMVSRRNFLRKKFLGKNIYFFHRLSTLRENCWTLANNLLTGLCLDFIVPVDKKFSEFFLSELNLFPSLCDIQRNNICRKFSGGVERRTFYQSIGNFWARSVFLKKLQSSDLERKRFCFLSKHFRRGCKTAL